MTTFLMGMAAGIGICMVFVKWISVALKRRATFQLAAFRFLKLGPLDGSTLRSILERIGIRRNGPSFYQEMRAMEEAGHVIGENVDGKRIYRIPGAGEILEAIR